MQKNYLVRIICPTFYALIAHINHSGILVKLTNTLFFLVQDTS